MLMPGFSWLPLGSVRADFFFVVAVVFVVVVVFQLQMADDILFYGFGS